MINRYYFYSANLHSNKSNVSEVTGYVSGIAIFKTLLPLNPLEIRRGTVDFIQSNQTHLADGDIHFIVLERFRA